MARKSNNYINNEELLIEIIKSKEIQKKHPDWSPSRCVTNKLAKMIMLLVENYTQKASFRNYTYLDDMQAEAISALCNNALKFDCERFEKPFPYYTQIVKYSILTSLEKEKKQRNIRDSLLESRNLTPSMTRQVENEMSNYEEK